MWGNVAKETRLQLKQTPKTLPFLQFSPPTSSNFMRLSSACTTHWLGLVALREIRTRCTTSVRNNAFTSRSQMSSMGQNMSKLDTQRIAWQIQHWNWPESLCPLHLQLPGIHNCVFQILALGFITFPLNKRHPVYCRAEGTVQKVGGKVRVVRSRLRLTWCCKPYNGPIMTRIYYII